MNGSRFLDGYQVSDFDLAVARIWIASAILLVELPRALWVSYLPDAFIHSPFSLGAMLSSFPDRPELVALNLFAACCALLMLVGRWTPWASAGAGLGLLLLNSAGYMTGKIDHDIFLVLAPLVMCGSGWGRALSLDASSRRTDPAQLRLSWALPTMALLIALAMFSAALPKALSGWLRLSESAVYGHLYLNYFVTDRPTLLSTALVHLPDSWFWEIQDWATIAAEAAGVLALWRSRWFAVWVVVLSFFHLGVGLVFAIWFAPNIAVYSLFLPWRKIAAFAAARPTRVRVALVAWAGVLGILFVGRLFLFDSAPHQVMQISEAASCAVVVLGSAVGAYSLFLRLDSKGGELGRSSQ